MKQTTITYLVLFISLISTKVFSQDSVYVYYLGGQSNMEGLGQVEELPKELTSEIEDVFIFQGNPVMDGQPNGGEGSWEKLKAGHGYGFHYYNGENNYSQRFGPELSFGKTIKELNPDKTIGIIKYARSGSSIDSLATDVFGCWELGYSLPNQYDFFLETVKNAYQNTDVNGDGKADILIPMGIIWMQGESDAVFTEAIALKYEDHLTQLMQNIRSTFRNNDLPIVIGRISDSFTRNGNDKVWYHGELIQYAQENFVKKDSNASIVRENRNYGYSDIWHYDSDGYIKLGNEFAESIQSLTSKKK